MLRRLIAILLLAAPSAAAFGQSQDTVRDLGGGWGIADIPNSCMLQATSPQGTMLSIWGVPGQDRLAFLLQNRGWNALHDGESYALDLDFLGVRSLPVEATAREEIDQDGPGFFFTMNPGGKASSGFLDAFATAKGMRISQNGRSVDTLPLAGSRGAMSALAKCLANRWSAGQAAAAPDAPDEPEQAPATPTT
jgi:hypothetical protein